ncbi:efflux transporter periplasmic adaptor subunit [Massilia eurypsychrophila]|uniref:Efflux transporter periplasmic adaptor subunit n=1 Tax=Massilia eurypsychrophila TaxID=1485217 RepID=A0A2G8TEB6_9BURK|nr:efflux RND transporter periplasmic adaptor subunit [Massilia eurypsychrophila]PIL44370.1 efflux transporter periplasmic adaptor subunit [Massilia eurypsychrophila]
MFVGFSRILLMGMLSALAALLSGCGPKQEQGQGPGAGGAGPPPVSVAPVTRRQVEEFDEFSARVAAVNQVDVRARVAGTLERVHFRDGQDVRKGTLLFTIDPRPFAAEVARLTATLASARSQASLAQLQATRAEKLLPLRAISEQEADQFRAAAQNAAAAVNAAQASLNAASLNLGFTRITAPIAGRASRTAVTAGNLVGVNEPVLTTIVSTDRVYAYFDASEAAFLKYGLTATNPNEAPVVQMGLFNEQGYPHKGRMDFVDNRLNQATGSMQLRAVFDNKDGRFTPGLSAHVKVSAGKPYEANLVPDRAITTDQTRRVVLVVGPKGVVEQREVKMGALIGAMRVVDGVKPGENIIVDGLQRAIPGMPVKPQLVQLDGDGKPLMPPGGAPATAALPAKG